MRNLSLYAYYLVLFATLLQPQEVYTFPNEYDSAKKNELKAKALMGDLVSAEILGRRYLIGFEPDTPIDFDKAVFFLEPVAERADKGVVQELLGNAYLKGKVGENYFERYLYWISKAAKNGLPGAKYQLANYYFGENKAQEKNLELAFWWMKSAAQDKFPGANKAAFFIGLDYLSGLSSDDAKRCAISRELFELNNSSFTEIFVLSNCESGLSENEINQYAEELAAGGSTLASFLLAEGYQLSDMKNFAKSYLNLAKKNKLSDECFFADLIDDAEFSLLELKISKVRDLEKIITNSNPSLVDLDSPDSFLALLETKDPASITLRHPSKTNSKQMSKSSANTNNRSIFGEVGKLAKKAVTLAVILPLAVLAAAADGSGGIQTDAAWSQSQNSASNNRTGLVIGNNSFYTSSGRTAVGSDGSFYSTNPSGTVTIGSDGSIYTTNQSGSVTIGSEGNIYNHSSSNTSSGNNVFCTNSGSVIICN